MRILVIGAGGQVGRTAVHALDGHEIIAASRSSEPSVDVTDPASVERLFATVGQVDAVIVAVGEVPFRPLDGLTRGCLLYTSPSPRDS